MTQERKVGQPLDRVGNLVSVAWLSRHLGRDDLVVADCRFALDDPEAGRRAYQRIIFPGAVYFDLEKDLSRPVSPASDPSGGPGSGGGRHPLPSVEEMAALFGATGSATERS